MSRKKLAKVHVHGTDWIYAVDIDHGRRARVNVYKSGIKNIVFRITLDPEDFHQITPKFVAACIKMQKPGEYSDRKIEGTTDDFLGKLH